MSNTPETRHPCRGDAPRTFVEALEPRQLLAGEPWGDFPRLIGQDAAITHYPSITGRGTAVAVIGTGIDYKHPALGGAFGPGNRVVAGYDFADDDGDPLDVDGHDTGVAGIIGARDFVFAGRRYRGLAPEASLIALRVDNGRVRGSEYQANVEAALQWVLANRSRYNIVAVNMSLGSGNHVDPVSQGDYADELRALHDAGVFIAAASGNAGVRNPQGINYPAADPNVAAVGAVRSDDVIATLTQRSDDLDLLAPGQDVPTTYYNPSTREHIYLTATGTSFAVPFAAAAAALLKQADPSLSADEVLAVLRQTGSPNFDGDREASPRTGLTFPRLDIDAAIGRVLDDLQPPPPEDDGLEDNDSISAASPLSFGSTGRAAIERARLLAGDPDFYRFTLAARSRLFADLDGIGSLDLFTSSGSFVATLADGASRDLSAGTYAVRASSSTTLPDSYGFVLTRAELAVEEPPPAGPAGAWSAAAYDRDGTLHVAWYDAASRQLRYATVDGSGDWSSARTVDSTSASFAYISLAIDAAGRPFIAYRDAEAGDLLAARPSGSSFSVTTLDAAGDTGHYASAVVDRNGNPAVAYYRAGSGDLRLVALRSGTWVRAAVDTSGDSGLHASLAVSPANGRLGIAYYSASKNRFMYARQTSSSLQRWGKSYVAVSDAGGATSLAFTRAGLPAFSFFDGDGADLRYAAVVGDAWRVQDVATAGSHGDHNSLLIDSGGRAYLYYHSRTDDALKVARLSSPSSSRWSIATLADDAGRYVNAFFSPVTGGRSVVFQDDDGRVNVL